jgi:hypothetical protein
MREACCDVAEESPCRLCPDGSHPTDYLDEQCESISFLIEVGHAASEFEDGPTGCDEFRTWFALEIVNDTNAMNVLQKYCRCTPSGPTAEPTPEPAPSGANTATFLPPWLLLAVVSCW